MRVGLVILPDERWSTSIDRWRSADELGFDSAWIYDHISWRGLSSGSWFTPVPILAAAACVTSQIRIGTLVTSPNFRHPVVLAKEAIALDDISDGRFVLGIGAGSTGAGDADVLGGNALSASERADRFTEFVYLTDRLLREPEITYEGAFYSAIGACMRPGCVQRPRADIAIAGTGLTAFRMAARYGSSWVTCGPTDWSRSYSSSDIYSAVNRQMSRFRAACEEFGREFEEVDRAFVLTSFSDQRLDSADAYLEVAERCAEIGITSLLMHWPRCDMPYQGDPALPYRIADQVLADIQKL